LEGPGMKFIRVTGVSALVLASGMSLGLGEIPEGWISSGGTPADYDISRDSSTAANGRYSALIQAKPNASPTSFGDLMQIVDAEQYRGGHAKLTGYLKTSDANRAHMWMRIDGPNRKVLGFDNMETRAVTGTTGWTKYEITLEVPPESMRIAFGFFLEPPGKVWGDNFKLQRVEGNVLPSAPSSGAPATPKAPLNGDFEF
jgi:hypothetical protein